MYTSTVESSLNSEPAYPHAAGPRPRMRPELPIEGLPLWAHLNEVTFSNVKIANLGDKGYGVVCEKNLAIDTEDVETLGLLVVPHPLVLNAEAAEGYAKEDRNFRQLLDAVGHRVGDHPGTEISKDTN